jgi:hypothetical protein
MEFKMQVVSFILKKFAVLLFVLLVAMQLCNGGSVSACNFSKNFERKTNTKVDVTSKKSIDDKANNKSMKLYIPSDLYPNLPPNVSSVFVNRISGWNEKDEAITVSDVGSTKNIKIYWAEFAYKQEFTNGTELSREIKLGIVFDEKEKLVWFGQIGSRLQEQFIYWRDEFYLFKPAVTVDSVFMRECSVSFDPSWLEKLKNDGTSVLSDQSPDALDKFVNDNFPYKNELFYLKRICQFRNYFSNPYFTNVFLGLKLKNLSIENELVRLDIGFNPDRFKFDSDKPTKFIPGYLPDGTLWLDLKKGTVEEVEDRTNYPPDMASARVVRESE